MLEKWCRNMSLELIMIPRYKTWDLYTRRSPLTEMVVTGGFHFLEKRMASPLDRFIRRRHLWDQSPQSFEICSEHRDMSVITSIKSSGLSSCPCRTLVFIGLWVETSPRCLMRKVLPNRYYWIGTIRFGLMPKRLILTSKPSCHAEFNAWA